MINGEEYHEEEYDHKYIIKSIHKIGFIKYIKKDLVKIELYSLSCPLVSKPYGGGKAYGYEIKAFFDSASFSPGAIAYFDADDTFDEAVLNKLEVPFASGIVRQGNKEYVMQEGSIIFGEFEDWYNVEPVRFECKAYCGDEVLEMKDCYVNEYSVFYY
ncbi:MAG: hypothetical protein IJ222_05265 [Bacteroidales bacterium]|nr:hypothetical protein [Bacteroidales bacterium]